MISTIGLQFISTVLSVTIGAWILAPPPPPELEIPAVTMDDDSASGTPVWTLPLDPIPTVTRPFDPPHPYGPGHRGIDLGAAPGAAVLAPDNGVIHFVGWVVDRPVLSIVHANGLISSFEPVVATLEKGDAVLRGVVVGHLATDPTHSPTGGLHLGARDGETYIDPLALLGAVPRAILLPLAAETL